MSRLRQLLRGLLPRQRRCLAFDGRVLYGSPEHYFHFTWGYLLPALHEILRSPGRTVKYLFRSCGPVMNPLITEVSRHFQVCCGIARSRRVKAHGAVMVPRWDIALLRPYLTGEIETSCERIPRMREQLKSRGEMWSRLAEPEALEELQQSIRWLRSRVLARAADAPPNPELTDLAGHYLVLQRSPQPQYYAPGGGTRSPGYGTARRMLRGVERTTRLLRERGVPIQLFEPGRHRWFDQVRVFEGCRGIVAIRGAELANLVWIRPGTRVIVITPAGMFDLPPPHVELCRLGKLELHDLRCGPGPQPELRPEMIEGLLPG